MISFFQEGGLRARVQNVLTTEPGITVTARIGNEQEASRQQIDTGMLRQPAAFSAPEAHAGVANHFHPHGPSQFALPHGHLGLQQQAYDPTMVASGVPDMTRQMRALSSPSKEHGQPAGVQV